MESAALQQVMPRWSIPVIAGVLAVAPDFDTVVGIAHRGVTHAALSLIIVSAVVALIVTRSGAAILLAAVWAGAAITHPLLDMLTDGGAGVMLFYPFSEERLFFPWRPIRVSPLSIGRFFERAGEILASEAPFDAAALAIGVILRAAVRRP